TARFSDATGLASGAPVLVAGVPVGRVAGLTVKGAMAIVTLDVSPDADLRTDMTAAIRSKTLLGERVVELLAGAPDAPPLRDGAVLTKTLPSAQPDTLLAALTPFFSRVDPADVAAVAHAAGDAARSGQLTQALDSLARLDTTLTDVQPRVDQILDDLDRSAPAVNHLVGSLNAAMPQVDLALAKTNGTLDRAPRFLDDADRLMDHTDRLALALDSIATDSPHLVRQTEILANRLPATLDRLDRLSDQLSALAARAGPALDLLNEPTVRHLLRDEGIRVHFGPF
ncbi:MAG: MCE family protein, partial [Cyanobacteria bacterium REEB65]|nr:MCE family protein [Cyanobacteria bacterium REEB65]